MDGERIKVVVVCGPTASGKTDLAAGIAKKLCGEVVSFDSMQLYDFAPIATAMPTTDEMQGVPHHMLGFLHAGEEYSVAKYVDEAGKIIRRINSKNKLPVLVGGTGLYYNTLIDNITFTTIAHDDKVRLTLINRQETEGLAALYSELQTVDPRAAETISCNDPKRIIRALEVFYSTGKTITEHNELSRQNPSPYEPCVIGLNYRDRQLLYDRINLRVDMMIKNGLLEEAERILNSETGGTGMQAIGIKELKPYFDGQVTLSEAVEKIKQESRRYAKRQLTWFRRDKRINWLYIDEIGRENLLKTALKIVENTVN